MSTKRHNLTPSQAQILAEIEQRRLAAVKEWHTAIRLIGLDPTRLVSGNLASDPHFMVQDDAPEA